MKPVILTAGLFGRAARSLATGGAVQVTYASLVLL